MPRPALPLGVRVLVWRLRTPLTLVGLVLAACLVARQAAPDPPPARDVVVAARDLAAGHTLTADDLRLVRMPRTLAPAGTVAQPADVEGRQVVVDVPAGLPLVAGVLGGGRFGLEAPVGTVAVPIRLADAAVAGLLRPGDRIDLVAPSDVWAGPGAEATTVLARAALVLDVTTDQASEDPGLLGVGASQGAEPLVVVAVGAEEGHRLAASGVGSLGAVLVAGS